MGNDTNIEWTDRTWNPIRGCSRVSPGCQNCYAEKTAGRFSGEGKPFHGFVKLTKKGARWTNKVAPVENHLHDPMSWGKPSKVFVNSMSDLFHEKLGFPDIAAIFGVMAYAQRHTFQFLTKRELELSDFYNWTRTLEVPSQEVMDIAADTLRKYGQTAHASDMEQARWKPPEWPLPNVWAGVSVENADYKHRIDYLRKIPAKVRFLSIEPLLGDMGKLELDGIHWVIVGAESGPGARPCEGKWIRNVVYQCKDQGVPVFLKQANEEVTTKQTSDGDYNHVVIGTGSKSYRKGGALISLPTLDGVTYANFPEVA